MSCKQTHNIIVRPSSSTTPRVALSLFFIYDFSFALRCIITPKIILGNWQPQQLIQLLNHDDVGYYVMRLWVAEYAKNKARKQGHFVLIPISRREKVPHWPTFHKQRRTNYIVPKMSNNICYQAKYTTSTNHPNPKVYDVKVHCRLHCQSYGLNLARKEWG